MQTNKQQRDKIVKQLDESRSLLRAAYVEISSQVALDKRNEAEELIVRAIANLYRLNL